MGLLYETNKTILSIVQNAVEVETENGKVLVNPETGELMDDELKKAQVKKEDMMLSMAKEIKNLKAEEKALKDEADALKKRADSAKSKADWLASLITKYAYGEKFKDTEAAISWRKAPVSVTVDDADKIPQEYRKELGWKPDLTAIKNALKAGETVDGCELTRKDDSLVIK